MKVLLVLTYYRPHWTGLTQYAARLAEGLAGRGHEVEVLCSRHETNLPLFEEINGVKVTRLPYLFRFLRSVITPGFPLHLWKKISRNDIAVAYLPLQEAALATVITKILAKKLYLVHNGDLVLPRDGGVLSRLVETMYLIITSFAVKFSRAVIVQTSDYAENSKLLSKFRNKWKIILPLYETPKVSLREVADFKRKNKLVGKVLIGFSGRFVEEKGVDFLLKAIPEVVRKTPNVHFIFAGESRVKYENFLDQISPLIEKNKGNLTLLGLLASSKEVFTFYHAVDLLVQPSRTDCFPSSQVEALLAGTPCVCSNIPGARWVISQTGMGVLFPPQNSEALAKGIIKALENRSTLIKQWPEVKKVFDYEKTLSAYEELFKKN